MTHTKSHPPPIFIIKRKKMANDNHLSLRYMSLRFHSFLQEIGTKQCDSRYQHRNRADDTGNGDCYIHILCNSCEHWDNYGIGKINHTVTEKQSAYNKPIFFVQIFVSLQLCKVICGIAPLHNIFRLKTSNAFGILNNFSKLFNSI